MDEVTREQWKVFWAFIAIVAVVAAVLWMLLLMPMPSHAALPSNMEIMR